MPASAPEGPERPYELDQRHWVSWESNGKSKPPVRRVRTPRCPVCGKHHPDPPVDNQLDFFSRARLCRWPYEITRARAADLTEINLVDFSHDDCARAKPGLPIWSIALAILFFSLILYWKQRQM